MRIDISNIPNNQTIKHIKFEITFNDSDSVYVDSLAQSIQLTSDETIAQPETIVESPDSEKRIKIAIPDEMKDINF